MDFIDQIDRRLKEINGTSHDFSSLDFIVPTEEKNLLVVSETDKDSELAVCLRKDLLDRLKSSKLPEDFDLELLPDLSIVIEELSHFNFYCESALFNRKLSSLDLEIQAEVDKFAVSLNCLEAQNEFDLRHALFDSLFDDLKMGDWVSEDEKTRYEQAHSVARAFCRQVLEASSSYEKAEEQFKIFFGSKVG
jgi:hypothetical protein